MIRTMFVALLAVAPGVAMADTKSTSYRDSLGYIHSDIQHDNKRTKCLTKTDSLGYTKTYCHKE
jgi:hypothetical protein